MLWKLTFSTCFLRCFFLKFTFSFLFSWHSCMFHLAHLFMSILSLNLIFFLSLRLFGCFCFVFPLVLIWFFFWLAFLNCVSPFPSDPLFSLGSHHTQSYRNSNFLFIEYHILPMIAAAATQNQQKQSHKLVV